QRASCLFTPPAKRRSERVAVNRLRHGEPLLGDEACFWLTFQRLARDRSLNSLPRIESHDRPIAAEGQAASCISDALPDPCAGSTIGAGIPRPNVQRVGVGVRMERLHASDYAELAESGNVGLRDRFNVLDAWPAIVRVVARLGIFVSVKRG